MTAAVGWDVGSGLALADWDALDTPVLTVDVGRLEHNIARTAHALSDHGVALRPHFKTSKCLEVAARQRAAGAVGFTCSTPAEVDALSAAGHEDLLWAHQPVGAAKVDRAVGFAASGRATMMVDSLAVAGPIAALARDRGVTVPVLVEVDTGHGRTGSAPESATALAVELSLTEGLAVVGVMTHEGQVAAARGQEQIRSAGVSAARTLVEVAESIRAKGLACDIVSVGSTPSLRTAPLQPGVTEARPGTYVYYDANQVRLGSATWDDCAQTVLTRVVSINRHGTAIIDAGLKAMSSDALTLDNGAGIVTDLAGVPVDGLTFATANEEHGFLVGDTSRLAVGDLLRVIPNHACGTTNMWSRLLAVHPGGSVEWWPIVARH